MHSGCSDYDCIILIHVARNAGGRGRASQAVAVSRLLFAFAAFSAMNQNSALFGARGKGITSRMFAMPVAN